ncbi:MAG: VWA domain-containing protein [Polyangiaceae bacterium]
MKLSLSSPLAPFLCAALTVAGCALASSINETDGAGGDSGSGGAGAGFTTTATSTDDPSVLAQDNTNDGTSAGSGGGGPAEGGAGGAGGGTGGSGAGLNPACDGAAGTRKFYMSPDDSSSMGSPSLAREYLRAGKAPPPALIRTYEFLNYYRVRFDIPAGDKLAPHAAFAPDLTGNYRLQVGVQAFDVPRPKMVLTFVVDTSGSLVGEGIARERAAITALAKQLQAGDLVNLVTWSTTDAEVLTAYAVTGPSDPKLPDLALALAPGGGSDLHAGLSHGYDLARKHYDKTRLNRVVLISDGGANLGVVDRDRIASEAKEADASAEPIYLVGIGVGPAFGYSDTLMNEVTDQGRGSYVYLDTADEANEVLGKRFDEIMNVAARDVQIAVTIPDYFEISTFSGEKYSQNKDAVQPQHIAPRDSMVLDQVLTLQPGATFCDTHAVRIDLTWSDPIGAAAGGENFNFLDTTIADITGAPWQLHKAEAIFHFATALRSRSEGDLAAALTALDIAKNDPALAAGDPYQKELTEIEELLLAFASADKTD